MAPAARFGIVLLPDTLAGFGALCREVEQEGFDWLGVADSQSVFRELYVALTIAALNTSRIRLGPLVTNPLTRHPVVTASAISSIDELSGGRAVLGLGSGDSAIFTLGAPPSTLPALEGAVTTLGRLHQRRSGRPPGQALAGPSIEAPGSRLPGRRRAADAGARGTRGRRGYRRSGTDAGGHPTLAGRDRARRSRC